MSATMVSSTSRTVVFTDGTTEFQITSEGNVVPLELLQVLFRQEIIGLRYVQKDSNVELNQILLCNENGKFRLPFEQNIKFKIIVKETLSTSNTQQQSIQEDNSRITAQERRFTPTNTGDRSEFNNAFFAVDQKIDRLSKDLTEKLDKISKDLTEKLDKTSKDLTEKIDKTSNDLKMLYKLLQPMIIRDIDPCKITARSCSSSIASLSKDDILEFYNLSEYQCMVCGHSDQVVNAHIWPKHRKSERLLSVFKLTIEDLNNPRNYLRLCKSLEVAFNLKQITIIEKQGFLVIYVLDQSLYHERVSDTNYTFEDCHLWPLRIPSGKTPFMRILAGHCRNSFTDAFRSKMIDYETYRKGCRYSVRFLRKSPDRTRGKILKWFNQNEHLSKKN